MKTFRFLGMALMTVLIGAGFAACGGDDDSDENTGNTKQGKAVDLGLPSGTKWADRNVGASSPEDYGDYFAWGETSPKDSYTKDNSLTYGMGSSTLKSIGIIDSDGNLTAKYDAATANWGGRWHMPTMAQINELINECKWIWTPQNGVSGYIVTGTNGNSIFLPAAGNRNGTQLLRTGLNGYHWGSTVFGDGAYYLYIDCGGHIFLDDQALYGGLTVRPVAQ